MYYISFLDISLTKNLVPSAKHLSGDIRNFYKKNKITCTLKAIK